MPPAILRVGPSSRGGLRLTVSDGLTSLIEDEIAAVAPEQLAVVSPNARVMVPGRDSDWMTAEDRASQGIARLLASAGNVWGRLQRLQGQAEEQTAGLTVAVDTDDPEWRKVPWELLSLGQGLLEGEQGGLVVRLGAGRAPSARGPHRPVEPTACVWVAGEDPVSERLAAELRQEVEAAGLLLVELDQCPSLLWVVAHGERAADAIDVATTEGAKGPGAVCARLADALPHAAAVILAVCHGGSPSVAPLGALSGRLLASGAGLVVAPVTSVHIDAIARFARGFLAAVSLGEPLGRCVSRGRREVRGWAFGHVTARWSQLQCWVSSVSSLEVVLRARVSQRGWPTPAPDAARWLEAALEAARGQGHAYLGVDHLLRTLMVLGGGGPVAGAVRWAAHRWLEPYDCILTAKPEVLCLTQGLENPPTPDKPVPTPRLAAIMARLSAGFGVEELARQIDEARPRRPQEPSVAQTVQTVQTVETVEHRSGPAHALQVHGGPQDGLTLRPAPGQTVGRLSGEADLLLYSDTLYWDRRVSRIHLRWEGDGELTAFRSVSVRQAHANQSQTYDPVDKQGVCFALSAGDELFLTPLTRVIGLAD